MKEIDALLELMQALRDPQKGCPWDLEQTMETIVPHTLEEAYELADAIEQNNRDEIVKECGDLLFQVIFYAQLAKEQGWFDFEAICSQLRIKLTNRHPHIFAQEKVSSAKEQSTLWETIKQSERGDNKVLSDIPQNLPALTRSQKVQKRAATVGFDWESVEQVLAKVEEEIGELKEVLHDKTKAKEECGDLLLACTNLARWLGADAEQLLRQSTNKFERRFAQVEQSVVKSDKPWQQYSLEELEALWQDVKRNEA